MAADSKHEHHLKLAQDVYSSLQRLECPLVDDLHLREAESIQELLCTPSVHRTEILKWVCNSICAEFTAESDVQTNMPKVKDEDRVLQFGYELLLCNLNDLDLVKGKAPPLQQLRFLEQMVALITEPGASGSTCGSSGDGSIGGSSSSTSSTGSSTALVSHLAQPHILEQLHNSCLCPLPTSVTHLMTSLQNSFSSEEQKSLSAEVCKEKLREVTDQLQAINTSLESLQKECEFLGSGAKVASSPQRPALVSSTMRVAATDLQQLMGAFSHIQYDLQNYCKPSYEPPFYTHSFQRVRQLLLDTNMELKAYDHLVDTSASMADSMTDLRTEKRFHVDGEMQSLPAMLDSLSKKYSTFLRPSPKQWDV